MVIKDEPAVTSLVDGEVPLAALDAVVGGSAPNDIEVDVDEKPVPR